MLTLKLRAHFGDFAARLSGSKPALTRAGLPLLYPLMTVRFVGCYLFLGHPYIDFFRFGQGCERLPFQSCMRQGGSLRGPAMT